jgi:hypothetical protein
MPKIQVNEYEWKIIEKVRSDLNETLVEAPFDLEETAHFVRYLVSFYGDGEQFNLARKYLDGMIYGFEVTF